MDSDSKLASFHQAQFGFLHHEVVWCPGSFQRIIQLYKLYDYVACTEILLHGVGGCRALCSIIELMAHNVTICGRCRCVEPHNGGICRKLELMQPHIFQELRSVATSFIDVKPLNQTSPLASKFMVRTSSSMISANGLFSIASFKSFCFQAPSNVKL